ncbi:Ig-like domain-containing protein [Patescibacteria group bacterium]|nr:Ig-like domain-containing protein [Patescibacteria group bacterium]
MRRYLKYALAIFFVVISFAFIIISLIIKLNQPGNPNIEKRESLAATLSSPQENELLSIQPTSIIVITFNLPVDADQIKYSIEPYAGSYTQVENSPNGILTIKPSGFWQVGTYYTLTLKSAKSLDGLSMEKELKFNFKSMVEY